MKKGSAGRSATDGPLFWQVVQGLGIGLQLLGLFSLITKPITRPNVLFCWIGATMGGIANIWGLAKLLQFRFSSEFAIKPTDFEIGMGILNTILSLGIWYFAQRRFETYVMEKNWILT